MAKSVRLFFSKPHNSKNHGHHVDSMRRASNKAKPVKTGHNPWGARGVVIRRKK